MNQLEMINQKTHGRIYNSPFYIIKHDKGEIYRIFGNLLKIFNQREKNVREGIENYENIFENKEWQHFLDWEKGLIEPVVVVLHPVELYLMSYNIINDKREKHIRHIYLPSQC